MAPTEKQLGATTYDLQPLEDALSTRGLSGIYTRELIQKLAHDTTRLRSGELSLADVKDNQRAPVWLRNSFTNLVNQPNPGLRSYSGHWYNSYLRIAAHGYGKGPDLLIGARHADGQIGPPNYTFDPFKTCAPVQLTSHFPHQDDQLAEKKENWASCSETFRTSKTRSLLQLQITSLHLQSGAKHIDKIVCMGLGTLTRTSGGSDAWFRPYFQHIVALSLAEAFDELYSEHPEHYGDRKSKVRLIAQDPNYSNSDKQILADNGITVVDDPQGLLTIDETTFVMSAFPSFPLYEIIADILPSGPAAIFDASLPTEIRIDSLMQHNEFAAPRVRKMLQHRLIYKLRWDETALNSINDKLPLAVHWLPRMSLFFQSNDMGAGGPNSKVLEDIRRRDLLVSDMLPTRIGWFRQWVQNILS